MQTRSRRAWTSVFGVSIFLFSIAGAAAAGQQQPPRDPKLNARAPVSDREQALQTATTTDPSNVSNWLELAKLQEERRAADAAERTLKTALEKTGGAWEVLTSFAAFLARAARFDDAVALIEDAGAKDPGNHAIHQLATTYYFEKAYKDVALQPTEKVKYVEAGIAAADRAIGVKDDYVDALVYKNLLLRLKADLETDTARRDALIAEAEALRARAMELNKRRSESYAAASPPPPPSPSAGTELVDGQQAVRVGGSIKPPAKLRDVRPVYPQEALDARVSGLVILEAVIDGSGFVRSAKVLRSIPLLDAAALDAVRQWQFTPTLLNGVPIPVVMTVTVNFTVQ